MSYDQIIRNALRLAKAPRRFASGGDVDQSRQLDDRGFYSAATEAARSLPQAKGSPSQMMATMKGVKPSELEWSGAGKAFADQKTVTRDDLAQYFNKNVPKIRETVLGKKIDPEILRKRQEIADMYFPEIKKYRNMSDLTNKDHHPDEMIRKAAAMRAEEIQDKMWEHMDREAPLPDQESTRYKDWTLGSRYGNETPSQRGYREILLRLDHPDTLHQSNHWDEPNVIAHLRMQDRGLDNDVLHLEELQSDWAQEGRDRGFLTLERQKKNSELFKENEKLIEEQFKLEKKLRSIRPRTVAYGEPLEYPNEYSKEFEAELTKKIQEIRNKVRENANYMSDALTSIAPYVTNTDHWTELALKRALIEAARGGYNKLVWTPGEEQAKRYSLGNHVDLVAYNPENKRLVGYNGDNLVFSKSDVEKSDLQNYLGREFADKIMHEDNAVKKDGKILAHMLRDQQLFMGGKGMKKYYGEILPNALRRILKPHTDKIQPTSHVVKNNDGEDVTLPGIEITPEMRESILKKGFSHYAHGGAVGYASGGDVDQPRNLDDMGFYSSAAESARSLPQSKGTPQQMLATMKGVKPAELEWSGVQDKFAGQKSVTKDDLAQHFEQNVPEIKETVLGANKDKKNMPTRQEVRNEFEAKLLHYNDIDEKYNSMIEDGKGHLLTEKDHEEYQHALSEMDRLTMELHERLEEIEGNEEDDTKYPEYTVGSRYGNTRPSERNYREVLLHLPGEKKFQSSHWEPANIVAHLRMQDRGSDNNILHLEELQSDWAQQGRDKGFDTKDMKEKREFAISEFDNYSKNLADKYGLNPRQNLAMYARIKGMSNDEVSKYENLQSEVSRLGGFDKNHIEPAPYVTNTDHWVELGLKRALLEAARGGYDKLVWTPGEEQAKRYDLSNHVDRVEYNPYSKTFTAYKDGEKVIRERGVEQNKIKDYIGHELAEKLINRTSDLVSDLNKHAPSGTDLSLAYDHLSHRAGLEGLDLKIGGEGMKSFYDKILPSALRRVLKPHTDKIQPTSHVVKGNDGEDVTLPGIEITPELRESILKRGFSYYARGGEVRQHFEDGGGAEGGSPAGDTGGSMGDTTGQDSSSGPEATQDSPAFTTEAPQLGLMDTARSAVHGALGTGPGIVGAIAGSPLGALAYGMEAINNAYYDGKARADIDPNAGGPGGQESGFAPPQPPNAPGSGFRLSNDDEETQAGMVKPVGFAPPPAPMMARGGVPRNSHPALSIPGVHIREEIHGRPIFLGDRDG